MNVGEFVTYFFARKYPHTGIVVRKRDYTEADRVLSAGSYLYTVDILEDSGCISTFDIHMGDMWKVILEHPV